MQPTTMRHEIDPVDQSSRPGGAGAPSREVPRRLGPNALKRFQARERKKEQIIRAAARMFNQHGFHAASLDDVAASLGMTKPMIYHYLGNKEQVLLECLSRGLNELRMAVGEADAGESGLNRLRFFLRRYAEVIMDDFGRCVARTHKELLSPEAAERFSADKRRIDNVLRDLIAAGLADGSLAPLDVKLTAFTFAGALNWLAIWHNPDGAVARKAIASDMVDTLLGGVLGK